jgi:2-hydroxychromene-2-carboxylate isomerase
MDVMTALLEEFGVDGDAFPSFSANEGRRALAGIQTDAEARGVFGVPSFLVGEELFWGAERLQRITELVSR